ncbi:MAG: alpha/beta fold hydrolase [Oscillospiraceae bacterium]|jgi:carboxylesterase|nr:alpha/beta fold hydrolase [Oscillospiraceae bacterium]
MKDTVYLIIHGFAGGLHETEYLTEFLRSEGLDVRAVLLSGHGGTKKDLRKTAYTDWIYSVENTVEELANEFRHIVLLGFSMGGLICLHFAGMPEVQKLVLVNAPIYFWNMKIILRDVLNSLKHRRFEKMRFYQKAAMRSSLKTNIDFLNVLSKSKKLLRNVKKPSLILQCVDDESVRPKSARYIHAGIGESAECKVYEGGCHLIFLEDSGVRDDICRDIMRFINA